MTSDPRDVQIAARHANAPLDQPLPFTDHEPDHHPHRRNPTMTDTATDQTLAHDLALFTDLQARISQLTEQLDALKGRLRADLGPGDRVAGDYRITITPQRRFSATEAERILDPTLLELCTITAVAAVAAKQVLPPAVYARCMVEHGVPKITVNPR